MKKLTLLVLLLALGIVAKAQQDPLYTQYLYNGLSYNPAYAGSREALSALAIYRNQWVGIEGAPETFAAYVHSPLRNEKIAIGGSFVHDRIGIFKTNALSATGAYRIIGNEGTMSFGLQLGANQLTADYTSVNTGVLSDPAFANNVNSWKPNAGVGLMYYTPKYYVALSAPYLIQNKYEGNGSSDITTAQRHYFASAAYVFELSNSFKIKPSALFKYTNNAPMQLDLSGTLIFNDVVNLGVNLRNLETISGMIQVFPNRNWYFGYAYDLTMNGLAPYNSGSHEIFVGFDISLKRGLSQSPRYF